MRVEIRSNKFKIEVAVDTCSIYTTQHTWRAYSENCSSDAGQVSFPAGMATDGPTLAFPERSLAYGLYCLELTSEYVGVPASSQIAVMLRIEESALVAIIDGGDSRTVTILDPVTIDGSTSYDPDVSGLLSPDLTYEWFCSARVSLYSFVVICVLIVMTTQCFRILLQPDEERESGSSSSSSSSEEEAVTQYLNYYCDVISGTTTDVIEVPASTLTPNFIYNITLVVTQDERESGSMTQMVPVFLFLTHVVLVCSAMLMTSCVVCTVDPRAKCGHPDRVDPVCVVSGEQHLHYQSQSAHQAGGQVH